MLWSISVRKCHGKHTNLKINLMPKPNRIEKSSFCHHQKIKSSGTSIRVECEKKGSLMVKYFVLEYFRIILRAIPLNLADFFFKIN